jgi:AcrR family transcriptional regulator
MQSKIRDVDESPAPVRRRTGGRSARVRESVLRATLEALTEAGLDGLTFSEIGRRAGVHATSIQRRWGSRENVLLEALLTYSEHHIPSPDTGSLRDDLVRFARTLRDSFATPLGRAILVMVAASTDDDRDLAAHRAEYMRIRYESARAMIQRAVDRGEVRSDIDTGVVLELALSPVYTRTLLTRQPVDDELIEQMIDTLVRGVAR